MPGPWRQTYHRRAPDAPASSWEVSGLLGFELEVRGGPFVPDAISPVLAPNLYGASSSKAGDPTGDILRGNESPYSFDPFGISIAAGYRILPYLSIGGFFDYANFEVNDGTDTGDYVDTTAQLQRQVWQLGAYVRFYALPTSEAHPGLPYFPVPIFNRLSPWIELGVGASQDTASYTRNAVQGDGGPILQTYYLSYWGVATNVRIGLDWRLAPIFSVGPVVGYGHTFGLSGCADAEPTFDPLYPSALPGANTCSSSYTGQQATANDYGMWFGGIFAKVTLGPDVR
jgi:hypothetical protein